MRKKSLILHKQEKSQIIPNHFEELKPPNLKSWNHWQHRNEPVMHGARRTTCWQADPLQHHGSIDMMTPQSSRGHASSAPLLLACSVALASVFLSLSLCLSQMLFCVSRLQVFKNVWTILDFFFYANLWFWTCGVCAVPVLLPTLLLSNDKNFCHSFFLIEFTLLFTLFLAEYIVICVSAILTVCVSIYFVFIWDFEYCVVEFFEILNIVLLSIYLIL